MLFPCRAERQDAFVTDEEHAERWEDVHIVAAGIGVPKAVGDFLILRAVRESGGRAMAVGDPAIIQAVEGAARKDGLLMCPEGGATLAAYREALKLGLVDEEETAVLFNCATGLKYPMADASKALDRFGEIDLAAL
jgi:threonine synthase